MTPEQELSLIESAVSDCEKTLQWKQGGTVSERTKHVLGQYESVARNSIFKTKNYMDDFKTMLKALEIITEGLTGDLNHSQKRTIANHLIITLRSMVDKITNMEIDFTGSSFDRFEFFRSTAPEKKLYEQLRETKDRLTESDRIVSELKFQNPELYHELLNKNVIPF